MSNRTKSPGRFSRLQHWASALLCAGALLACAASRQVHEPISYPDVQVQSGAMDLEIADPRGLGPEQSKLSAPSDLYAGAPVKVPVKLPSEFKKDAAKRLGGVSAGSGPVVRVVAEVEHADLVWASQPPGRVARVNVEFTFSVYAENGELLQRGKGGSWAELPGEEATPDEIGSVLEATALNAFDRYWASEKTLSRLNRALGG